MRGDEKRSDGLFSYVRPEERIAADHPLRAIRALVEEVLGAMTDKLDALYSHTGRPSIPPEQLLKATLLQAFFTVRQDTPADGADRLQSAVPLVRGVIDGRWRLGRLDVF